MTGGIFAGPGHGLRALRQGIDEFQPMQTTEIVTGNELLTTRQGHEGMYRSVNLKTCDLGVARHVPNPYGVVIRT